MALRGLRATGPVSVLPEKTRIALHVRMSFAAFTLIETYSPRNVLHAFRLNSPSDVDGEFTGWLLEAYRSGS